MKIIGIKYDLFADEEISERPAKKKTQPKEPAIKKTKALETKKETPGPVQKANPPIVKVIRFPKPDPDEEDSNESVAELKGYARQALRALEKNNSVAAYNLLKRIVDD